MEKKEYIVTLISSSDLDSFYKEMESNFGSDTIPYRNVELASRREYSRNTHYFLTEEEAEQLALDKRVLNVSLTNADLGFQIRPRAAIIQSGIWDKSAEKYYEVKVNHGKNWGLYQCIKGNNIASWGTTTGTANSVDLTDGIMGSGILSYINPSGYEKKIDTINFSYAGKDVDVIICDGFLYPDHPEFLDSRGKSRFIPYNWFKHNPEVNGTPSGNYVYYTGYNDYYFNYPDIQGGNDHGIFVAGITCGNTQGWAREANIYNLNPYGEEDPNNINSNYLIDYIRAFHRNKPINTGTNRKNPTIVNCSWGLAENIRTSRITGIVYSGINYTAPFTSSTLKNLGIGSALSSPLSSGLPYSFWVEASSTPVNTDFEDGALEGIIFISAAGNDSTLIDNPGGPNYNNRLYLSTAPTTPIYINRGGTPNEARIKSNNVQNTFLRSGDKACIIVGATSAFAIETKSYFSNNGPAVDVFAPGENIISAAYDTNITNMRDPRVTGSDPQKLFGKVLDKGYGTSYAAPQVCGMLACALELYPNMDTKLALNYINNRMSVSGKLDPNNLFAFSNTRFSELLGAPNRSARFFEERNSQFEIYPKKNYFIRNIEETGVLYPRTRNKNF